MNFFFFSNFLKFMKILKFYKFLVDKNMSIIFL